MIHLTLPKPPSTNGLFANVAGKGRVRSKRYKTWANSAGWDLKAARQSPIRGPVDIRLSIGPPRKGADIDNKIKAVVDLLVTHKLIEGDGWPIVRSVSAEWSENVKGCVVAVFPAAARYSAIAAE